MPADDQPWIASRCMRLIRPISSRLTALRREHEVREAVAREARVAAAAVAKANLAPVQARKPRGFDKVRDPDWVPGAKPTGVSKRTYGGRPAKKMNETRRQLAPPARPGAIPFTPIVSRNSDSTDAAECNASPTRRRKRGPLGGIHEQMQSVKRRLPHDTAKTVEALLDAYSKLLQATSWCEEDQRKGSRSFKDTCLRQLSKYIENEEHFARVDREEEGVDEDRDVPDEVYTQLQEMFEASQGRGWRPLGKAVRAHGTELLCKAFAEGILGNETFRAVVMLCFQKQAWLEAELFLTNAVHRAKAVPLPYGLSSSLWERQNSPFLSLVHQHAIHTGRYGLLYSMLAHMLREGLLPLEWLATESMQYVWNTLVTSLNQPDAEAISHILEFLETVVLEGAGILKDSEVERRESEQLVKRTPSARKDIREALDTTYFSLLTILASLARVSQDPSELEATSSGQRAAWILHSLAIDILHRNDLCEELTLSDMSSEDAQMFARRLLWTMTAGLCGDARNISPTGNGCVRISIRTFVRSLRWTCQQYADYDVDEAELLGTLPRFIASTARCSGRAQQDDGLSSLQTMINDLLHHSRIRLPAKAWDMKRLALESSYEFAHQTNDKDHFLYAKQVQELVSRHGRIVINVSPQKLDTTSAPGGFRWEEGMGELVACTPFPKRTKTTAVQKPVRLIERLPSPASRSVAEDDVTDNGMSQVQPVEVDSSDDSEESLQPFSSFVDEVPDTPASSLGSNSLASSPVKASQPGSEMLPTVFVASDGVRARGSFVAISPAIGKRHRSSSPMVIIPSKRSRLTSDHKARSTTSSMCSSSSEEVEAPRKVRSCRLKTATKTTETGAQSSRPRRKLERPRRNVGSLDYSEVLESSDTDEDDLVAWTSSQHTVQPERKRGRPAKRDIGRALRPRTEPKHSKNDRWAFMDEYYADELSFDL